ncbi:Na/Pi cotransporter family protein [Clostridium ganghwense]|uniref:Na/Pi cotransporter family protein n=1 Tax=Clostridium ganghwense TaxID=312089 RepID=A0ABT4CR34_9CLOT|nr:Na/Pi cotransporter family protein [Clostridium ganghwense]MCY6371522.1 Na/Pi cotransporter family protein [Clostridium ganghwense]
MSLMNIIIGLLGGLGLFLYGMKLMGEGLENVAGDKMKVFFEKITSNPAKGILTGAIVTAVIQSSSATTVMVVGFVNAGLMNLYQAAGVIMGANIGTTITTQIISFKMDGIIPIFIALGAAMLMFSKKEKVKEVGHIILGFGILFLGMELMKETMAPLAESDFFGNMIVSLQGNIFLSILVGVIMTAVIQSSSASTGILVALSGTGALPIEVAVPILFGNNIGTCVTALLSSVGTQKTAKKAAFIHLFFNVIGTVVFIPLIPILKDIVVRMNPSNITRQIANAHTIFNIANTIVMIPFMNYLVLLVNKIIPGEDETEKFGTKYIDERLLETPIIASGQAIQEIIRMARKAKENLIIAMKAFETNNQELNKKVYENEKLINLLEHEITTFLVKLSNADIAEEKKNMILSMFNIVNDIERVGDHCKNIADLTNEKIQKKLTFSDEGMKELRHMYEYTIDAVTTSIASFKENDMMKAQSTLVIEENIDRLEKEYREAHIRRLNKEACSAREGAIYLDLISNFERIGDHSTNIAQSVINR